MRIQKLKLKKLNNTRDLGGLPAEGGKKIRKGCLIRSGRIYKLPKSTVRKFEEMGVDTVVDMRTEKEREEYPSSTINGATYYHLPLTCTATRGITHEKSMARTMLEESKRLKHEFDNAPEYMMKMYDILLFAPEAQENLKKFFELVLAEEKCILWHCSAGKDRTGVGAMLLEWVLGVDEEVIIADYVASDRFQRGTRLPQRLGLIIAPIPRRFKLFLYAQMKAKPEYVIGAMQAIKDKYGDINSYFTNALGISEEQIQQLKDKYLE